MDKRVAFFNLQKTIDPIREQLSNAYLDFLQLGQVILGPRVNEFELWCSGYLRQEFTVGVNSGLDALIISLKALNIGPGDEVIVPSNTYIATWLAVTSVGAVPKPVEPNPSTMNITANDCKPIINSSVKAILPVHLYGLPCDMPAILDLANEFGMYVIEDNAQAFGARIEGRPTGSWGHINAHSFYPTKNLGAFGDGGMVSTNDKNLFEWVKKFRNYGSSKRYTNDLAGANSRLDEIQASWLLVKSTILEQQLNERKTIAKQYNEGLSSISDLILPFISSDHSFHLYVIRTKKRDDLAKYLALKGIETLIHYPIPPHLQSCYKYLGYKPGDFPIAESLASETLSLPLYPGIGKDVDFVIQIIHEFFANH